MDGIFNHYLPEGRKIDRVMRSQPPKPVNKRQEDGEHAFSSYQKKPGEELHADTPQEPSQSSQVTQTGNAEIDSKTQTVMETVTISLERYEALKFCQDKMDRMDQRIRDMCDYRLMSVKGDHAAYSLLVDESAFRDFVQQEILEQSTIQIADVHWRTEKEKNK